MPSTLHICSLNCQGLGQKEKRERLFAWVRNQKCNVLFSQETHFVKENLNTVKNEFAGDGYHSFGNSNSRGVSIFIKKEVKHSIIDQFEDKDGRMILINVEIDDNILTLVNLYAPNYEKDRNIFFKKVNDVISKYTLGILIIGGDMNETLNNQDRKNRLTRHKNKKPVNSLRNMIKKHKLVDIWRILNPTTYQYTWRRKNNNEIASRIDYFLVNNDIRPRIISADIRPAAIRYTDHQAISIKIKHNCENKGNGYFKLNNSILNDDKYRQQIINLINQYKQNTLNKDLTVLWDLFKKEVRDITVAFCKVRAKEKRNEIYNLEQKLKMLYNIMDETSCSDKNPDDTSYISKKITLTEEKLSHLYTEQEKGAQIRSRAKWIEQGEKNSKFFLGLEKARQTKKNIATLRDINGILVQDQDKILELEREYYKKLYTSQNPDKYKINDYINNTVINNKLSAEDSERVEGKVTVEECKKSVFSMKLNKSPGIDGLSVEFYRTFWSYLDTFVVEVFNKCYEKKELTELQKIGLITLIYKKNDPYNLDNYRPITLLNVDTKIIAYSLAQRLKPILHKIIHSDQNGYVQNRYIGFNIRQIQDIKDYSDKLMWKAQYSS